MVYLVVGGDYTPPSPTDIQLQLGDDPLLGCPISISSVGLSSITVTWQNGDIVHDYNPQADVFAVQRSINGTDWETLNVDITQGQYTETGIAQGNHRWYRTLIQTDLSPNPKQTIFNTDGWTDFLITVQSCKDSEGNIIANAVILALPEEELLEKVSRSATGTPLPSLSYRRANKTDQDGQCSIRIPGGKGKVWVIMIPPTTTIAGHARAHLTTQEE